METTKLTSKEAWNEAANANVGAKLDLIAMDMLPSSVDTRKAVVEVVVEVAAEHGGEVTMAWIRPKLDKIAPHRNPKQVGAQIGALVGKGILEPTGKYAPSGNRKTGNVNRPMNIYRLNYKKMRDLRD